jgi:hypothetical protein
VHGTRTCLTRARSSFVDDARAPAAPLICVVESNRIESNPNLVLLIDAGRPAARLAELFHELASARCVLVRVVCDALCSIY